MIFAIDGQDLSHIVSAKMRVSDWLPLRAPGGRRKSESLVFIFAYGPVPKRSCVCKRRVT